MTEPNNLKQKVELVEYDPEWPQRFAEAAHEIQSILQANCIEIHHIGSTSIPHVSAKPIIDMLPVVKDIHEVELLQQEFKTLGYVYLGEYGIAGRRYFWKSKSHRTHNVHIFEQGSPDIKRHLAFRDFMIQHQEFAAAYSLVKKHLAAAFPYDIDNYAMGKNSFIEMMDYRAGCIRASQISARDIIVIEAYHPAWPRLAEAEINTIKEMTTELPMTAIEHIGSTAVPDLPSKPIIDIFISVPSITQFSQWVKPLEKLGYVFWDENPDKTHGRFFKGMPPYGTQRTHHVHIVEENNPTMEHRILFRDILRNDKNLRDEYETLKLALSLDHATDREIYTDKKGEFIEKVLRNHGYQKPISR